MEAMNNSYDDAVNGGSRRFRAGEQGGTEDQRLSEDLTDRIHMLAGRLKEVEGVVRDIQMNLFGPQQRDLEGLVDRGYTLLRGEVQAIKDESRSVLGMIQDTVKSNPWIAILAAVRVGMAIRQTLMTHRDGLPAPLGSDQMASGTDVSSGLPDRPVEVPLDENMDQLERETVH